MMARRCFSPFWPPTPCYLGNICNRVSWKRVDRLQAIFTLLTNQPVFLVHDTLLSKLQNLVPTCQTRFPGANPSKSGECIKQKAIPSFLGDVGLIKEVSEFLLGHLNCHISVPKNGHLWQKWPSLCAQKWHFECPTGNFETTFISPTSPKNDGVDFSSKHLPLLDGFSANLKYAK